jgi:hypothetical protein
MFCSPTASSRSDGVARDARVPEQHRHFRGRGLRLARRQRSAPGATVSNFAPNLKYTGLKL